MVSIVIETENVDDRKTVSLKHMAAALKKQTFPIDQCEIVCMIKESESSIAPLVKELLPTTEVKILKEPVGYGQMKMYGARLSKSPIVAFIDSDCVPNPTWLESIVKNFESVPSDVMVLQGLTTFCDQAGSDFYTTHVFGIPWMNRNGNCEWIILNNFAVRKETFDKYPFADLSSRQGTEYSMVKKLVADGKKIKVVPEMRVIHNYKPGFAIWFRKGQTLARDWAETIRDVMSLHTSPEVIKWRLKTYRLCFAYVTWVFRDLIRSVKLRSNMGLNNISNMSLFCAAFTDLIGGIFGIFKWKAGIKLPETPF